MVSTAKLRFSSLASRVFRRQKERQHLHMRSTAIPLFSRLSHVFPINYICQVGARNSVSRWVVHAWTKSRSECRFTQNRSPFLRDSVGQQRGRERERETAANATTYPVDVGAGHRKTYNLTNRDRTRCAKRSFDLFSRTSIITGIFVRTSTLHVEFACN